MPRSCARERLADLDDLAVRLGRAEVDRGADAAAEVWSLTEPNMIWSNSPGRSAARCLIFTMNGILCAYWREQSPSTPKVVATALFRRRWRARRCSSDRSTGIEANEAAAECSMPWSTGRIDTWPVSASRPWSKILQVAQLRRTVASL
jgi:hypothetical protein